MEIPTAAIHILQSSLREAASAPSPSSAAAPAPPFPSVADAVAAFNSDASSEFRCGRCGAAGGLLRGAQSAVCAYCGCPRREEGGGVAFRGSAAYRWLLGLLGLDGSGDEKLYIWHLGLRAQDLVAWLEWSYDEIGKYMMGKKGMFADKAEPRPLVEKEKIRWGVRFEDHLILGWVGPSWDDPSNLVG